MVLNGFAMFLRNVLVCKDAKAATLLDVVEGMQERYITAAKSISPSFLVSALNILNEAEINYKMSRNKRLHVEMAIIKLNFLQQALDLSVEGGEVVKKKRIDSPVAYRSKTIQPLQPSVKPVVQTGTTLLQPSIGVPPKAGKQPLQPAIPDVQPASIPTESKLFIEPAAMPKPAFTEAKRVEAPTAQHTLRSADTMVAAEPVSAAALALKSKRSLLSALRDKYGDQYSIEEVEEAEPLEMEKLRVCWNAYAAKLEEQLKHSAANTFKLAKLTIESDTKLLITVNAIVQQKFVEGEKTLLADCIQKTFHNTAIQIQVVVADDVQEEISPFLIMNSRERYNYIVSQYPLVKELKERLRLEIDSI